MFDHRNAIHQACERGDVETAIEIAEWHLHSDPDDGSTWEMLGLMRHACGRFAESVAALETASLLVPLGAPARVCLGHGYGKIDRPALSADLLAALIDDESLSTSLLLQVATGLDAVGKPQRAMHACRVASQRDPLQAQPYYDLGYYAAQCGYPARFTESLARKAISLDPDNVCYRVGLASLLVKLLRSDDAHQVVRRLSNEQIERIACRCCLERIVDLYETAGDLRRVVLCREQLLRLEARGTDSDCE